MPDMEDRKSKKSKKKQAMSEPVDLEAGEHVTDPEAPTIAKAIYEKPSDGGAAEGKTVVEAMDPTVSKSLGDSTVVDTSTSQTSKGVLEGTQRASIPPPPKSKAKIHNTEDAIETTDGRSSRLKPDRSAVVPDIIITQHDASSSLTQGERGGSAGGITGPASSYEVSPANSENEEEARSVRYGDFGLEFAASNTTDAQTTKACKQQKPARDLVNIKKVSDCSHDVTLVEIIDMETANIFLQPNSAAKKAKNPVDTDKSTADTSKDGPVAEQSAQRKFSSDQQQQKATNTNRLPALPPFDHESLSRFDNIHRPTDKDFGSLIELQTNDGTFSHIHISILRQIPRFKEFVDQSLPHLLNPTRAHTLRLRGGVDFVLSNFDGVSSTYIHWLYNGNLPTSIIDTRHGRTVSDVLLSLAEEYLIGARVSDGRYMNYIMDAFITLQVRTRWLALPYVVELAYEEPADCPMLGVMLADLHAFIFVDKAQKFDFSMLEKMPKEFVVEVLESVVVLKPNEVGEWYWYLKDTGKTYHV
ncbi:hypothetical protein E8E11_000902 [Didymella keratinophila]|nr:hypothetical protein E8E11_000902 [Didymella keratinophila]